VNYKVVFDPAVSQRMVDTLGLEPALRLLSTVRKLLEERGGQFLAHRDPNYPRCFQIRVPCVSRAKGGWYECSFSVDDGTPGELNVVGFAEEFRPVGPI
jgi:hypothetical protein